MGAPILIAIDGGGSGSRLCLLNGDQRIEATGGPANVTSAPDTAVANLRAGLSALGNTAGLDPDAVRGARICMGLAGVLDGADRARITQAFVDLPHLQVLDDRAIALRGAYLDGTTGSLAGIGTGSYVGLIQNGHARFAGGWGLALGDEASGAWLARRAIACALTVHEGRLPPSPLTIRLLADGPAALIRRATNASAHDIATLAPDIASAADTGDANATALMQTGAAYLAQALSGLGWAPAMPLVLLGGLAPRYVPYLPPHLHAALTPPQSGALDGALAYAREMP